MNSIKSIVKTILLEQEELADYTEQLIGSGFGVYIPQTFMERYKDSPNLKSDKDLSEYWSDLEDIENEYYWDSWDMILQSIEMEFEGNRYYVDYMDSDLVAFRLDMPDHLRDELDGI